LHSSDSFNQEARRKAHFANRLAAAIVIRYRTQPPAIIFLAAFAVRVLYLTLAHTYRFSPFEDRFTYGYEMARIARALVTGYGYADPFSGHTGLTAWVPPAYPLLIALVFRVFGVYTLASAWMLLTLNSLFSATTCVPIYDIAARCYGRRAALWSAWIWALYPAAMQYAVRLVWETSLTTLLFTAALALALRMRGIGEAVSITPPSIGAAEATQHASIARWLLFGVLWSVIALSNPSLLLFLPVCGVWLLLGSPAKRPSLRSTLLGPALAALLFCACLAPWTLRNARVFHAFIPLRSNFGAELYAGNGPGTFGFRYGVLIGLSPRDPQHQLYARLGEVAYVRQRGALARAWIRQHPGRCAALSLKRFYFFWASVPHPTTPRQAGDDLRELNYCFSSVAGLLGLALALKRRTPAAALLAWAFVLLPLTYYFVTVEARFRHPLEPLIVILAVYLFQSAGTRPGGAALESRAALD
jgi:4-amino-4-deoxy-L-arabinose transferase-like glycosyltransferase